MVCDEHGETVIGAVRIGLHNDMLFALGVSHSSTSHSPAAPPSVAYEVNPDGGFSAASISKLYDVAKSKMYWMASSNDVPL
jgi:hypothetical protein